MRASPWEVSSQRPAPMHDALWLAARSLARPLGRAEACRRDHLSDLDRGRPLAAYGLCCPSRGQAARADPAGSCAVGSAVVIDARQPLTKRPPRWGGQRGDQSTRLGGMKSAPARTQTALELFLVVTLPPELLAQAAALDVAPGRRASEGARWPRQRLLSRPAAGCPSQIRSSSAINAARRRSCSVMPPQRKPASSVRLFRLRMWPAGRLIQRVTAGER